MASVAFPGSNAKGHPSIKSPGLVALAWGTVLLVVAVIASSAPEWPDVVTAILLVSMAGFATIAARVQALADRRSADQIHPTTKEREGD